MIFVSYADNFEDVLLWRALRDQAVGFFVDVGAMHPDTGSVSRAFHDRGWRGVNVTPLDGPRRRLEASRLQDTTLHLTLAESTGQALVHTAEGVGFATADPATQDALAAAGHVATVHAVPQATLASVLDRHAPADIHFLRIDAAGAEARVLAGADLAAHRPWIVIVRAVTPLTNVPSHAAWAPGLTAAGYRFVWFDGISRFYLAEERADSLGRHFIVPPNVHDGFVRVADTEWALRIGRAEARAAALEERATGAEVRARHDTGALMELRVLNEHRLQQIRALDLALTAAHQQMEVEAQRTREVRDWLEAVRRSTSWRATLPIRVLARGLARRRGAPVDGLPAIGPAADNPALTTPPTPPDFTARPSGTPPAGMPAAGAATRRIVHQFHAGSARGDAITNGMLLIRGLLRGLGYASEIYCDQPDPELGDALRPSAELPLHDAYVLLVHFSLGFENFEAIARLPCTKVLMYHNITPPGLLTRAPVLQGLAQLGHAQLVQWRPLVAAALAVSEYNALDLRGLGYPVVRSCPLLFDIDAMRAQASLPVLPRADAAFTILFVGRLVESKAQNELVAAFAAFLALDRRPARLVLVGRAQATGDSFIVDLHRQIADAGLGDRVVMTGFVDDAALRQHYRDADLYVSLSHHEGFGVPLIEAMAHGVPVLAWPSGAVPYTVADGGELLTDRAPAAVAARIAALADDPALRQAIVRRQHRLLDRFRLVHHLPALEQALALAGAAPPRSAGLDRLLDTHLRFVVTGHVNGSYSLAAVNRGVARAIEAVRPGRVRIVPVEAEADLAGVPEAEAPGIAALAVRPRAETGPVVVISQHYPVLVPPDRGDALLALFFWEESVIPQATVRVLNQAFHGVLAPSGFVAKTLVDSGVSVPVHVVGQSPELAGFRAVAEDRARAERDTGRDTGRDPGRDPGRDTGRDPKPVTFLHVSSCLPRKGVDILLSAYARAFRRGDAVRLVIKGFPNPHNDVAEQVAALQAADADAPAIVFINHDLPADGLLALYRSADVMVLPTRGEGFNLPAAEAMAAGLPLIVTGFGGQADFCDARTARLLAFAFAPSRSHLATAGSVWVEPSVDDLVNALRESVAELKAGGGAMAARARAAAARVGAAMTVDRLVARLADAATATLLQPPPTPARIAWITTWDVRCGVAEYARNLLLAWPVDPMGGATVVLADDRTAACDDAAPRVRVGWRLGAQTNTANLSAIVAQEDPDVVVIQHQPGFMPWPELTRLLRSHSVQRRVTTVTLHSTRHLTEIGADERQGVVAALATVARVIVHTVADLTLLHGMGLQGNVVLMPHGVPAAAEAAEPVPAPRLLGGAASPVVGCYGFFLPGKGIPQLIAAAALLRRSWPGLRLRLVNAEYGTPESAAEIASCRALAAAAGLDGAVDWHVAFLPKAESRRLLAGCDVAVLPYQSSREASSAALRSVLEAGVPVAVTPLAVFDDAAGAVQRLGGLDPVSIAEGVGALLGSQDARAALLARAAAWQADHSTAVVAERMHGMLRGLLLERDRRINTAP